MFGCLDSNSNKTFLIFDLLDGCAEKMNTTNIIECDLQWNIDHLKPFIVLHQKAEMLFNRISIFI